MYSLKPNQVDVFLHCMTFYCYISDRFTGSSCFFYTWFIICVSCSVAVVCDLHLDTCQIMYDKTLCELVSFVVYMFLFFSVGREMLVGCLHPNKILVYLRDASAQTVVHAATLR